MYLPHHEGNFHFSRESNKQSSANIHFEKTPRLDRNLQTSSYILAIFSLLLPSRHSPLSERTDDYTLQRNTDVREFAGLPFLLTNQAKHRQRQDCSAILHEAISHITTISTWILCRAAAFSTSTNETSVLSGVSYEWSSHFTYEHSLLQSDLATRSQCHDSHRSEEAELLLNALTVSISPPFVKYTPIHLQILRYNSCMFVHSLYTTNFTNRIKPIGNTQNTQKIGSSIFESPTNGAWNPIQ